MEQSKTLPTTLLPEILGFSPQMLLDDIISEAGDAILQCLNATELFMRRWADARAETVGEDWDGVAAVEQVRMRAPLLPKLCSRKGIRAWSRSPHYSNRIRILRSTSSNAGRCEIYSTFRQTCRLSRPTRRDWI